MKPKIDEVIVKDIQQRFDVNCAITDKNGEIIASANSGNMLCPLVKRNDKAKFICAAAHQLCFKKVKESIGQHVQIVCDIGVMKIGVPLVCASTNEFLGMLICCGLLDESTDVEVDILSFLLEKDEDEIEELSLTVPRFDAKKLDELLEFIMLSREI